MFNEETVMEGSFLGMPVRFDASRAFNNFWNREDSRVFLPTNFGIGWDVNFRAIARHLGLVRG
jgi:uncharacterized membrane protein